MIGTIYNDKAKISLIQNYFLQVFRFLKKLAAIRLRNCLEFETVKSTRRKGDFTRTVMVSTDIYNFIIIGGLSLSKS